MIVTLTKVAMANTLYAKLAGTMIIAGVIVAMLPLSSVIQDFGVIVATLNFASAASEPKYKTTITARDVMTAWNTSIVKAVGRTTTTVKSATSRLKPMIIANIVWARTRWHIFNVLFAKRTFLTAAKKSVGYAGVYTVISVRTRLFPSCA